MPDPTKIIAVVNGKGGVGKSTVAVNLATAMSHDNKAVCVIDLDPQVTATKWKDRRKDENPAVVATPTARLRQTLDAARKANVDYVIIDTAGRNDSSGLDAARVADLILIPTTTSIVAIEALEAARDTVAMAGNKPALVLLNQINPTSTRQADEAREAILQLYGLRCCPVHLCRRAIYDESMTPGESAQEADGASKAADEVRRLYEFVVGFLNKGG
jgi:chromosome partitioning protein